MCNVVSVLKGRFMLSILLVLCFALVSCGDDVNEELPKMEWKSDHEMTETAVGFRVEIPQSGDEVTFHCKSTSDVRIYSISAINDVGESRQMVTDEGKTFSNYYSWAIVSREGNMLKVAINAEEPTYRKLKIVCTSPGYVDCQIVVERK